LLATIALFQAGMPFLHLKVLAVGFFDGVCTAAAVFGVTWLVFRVIDLLAGVLRDRMQQRGQASAVYLVPLGARTLKIVIGVFTALAALDNLGFDVTTIIAGLGVGGLAVALALRPTLENIFGGVTVLIDQPIKPGEFCRYGDKLGTVEEVGIRSTRIRSLDRTVVTVANSDFSSMQIENFAKRDRVRLHTTLGLRYETTADQLRYTIAELRRLIESHEKVFEQPRRVRLVGFGASSLDVELLCYIATADYAEFLAVREDMYLRMIDIVEKSGSGFAFPSTTVYRAEDTGLDDEKARAAEAQVAAWREKGELMFPDYTDEERSAMRDSIAYPPPGSAMA
jgi:MscS family membrane protein